MLVFRIGDRRHKIFEATGAMLHGGRWNSPGKSVISAAQTYAGALLEVLVHANLDSVPRNHAVVEIFVPDDFPVETVTPAALSGWNSEDLEVSRRFGDRWLEEQRTPILRVPSLVLQAREHNILINPAHPQFNRIHASEPEAVVWDVRLFPEITPAG